MVAAISFFPFLCCSERRNSVSFSELRSLPDRCVTAGQAPDFSSISSFPEKFLFCVRFIVRILTQISRKTDLDHKLTVFFQFFFDSKNYPVHLECSGNIQISTLNQLNSLFSSTESTPSKVIYHSHNSEERFYPSSDLPALSRWLAVF